LYEFGPTRPMRGAVGVQPGRAKYDHRFKVDRDVFGLDVGLGSDRRNHGFRARIQYLYTDEAART
jgi:hypothetical protein